MALPGLLVEYLVVGSMALLWALPLAGIDLSGQIPFGSAAALAPAIYVLGMFVDFAAFVLLTRFPLEIYSIKQAIRVIANHELDNESQKDSKCRVGDRRNSKALIKLGLQNMELLKEVKERSSRDRIARGALVNILILWLISFWVSTPQLITLSDIQWAALSLFAFVVWVFLERHSYRFEVQLGHELDEVNNKSTASKGD